MSVGYWHLLNDDDKRRWREVYAEWADDYGDQTASREAYLTVWREIEKRTRWEDR